jgi:4,4'-diaponeurosporenoate glycosyltransferase
MVSREAYAAVGGHRRAAGALLEGLQLGQAFADAGYDVHCLGGRGNVAFRMYPDGARTMIDGLARGFATGAGSVPAWLLVAIVAWIVGSITTTRHLLVGLFGPGELSVAAVAMMVLYAGQMRWMLARIGNFGWWPALLFPIPVATFLGVFSLSLFRTHVKRRVSWKGRSLVAK